MSPRTPRLLSTLAILAALGADGPEPVVIQVDAGPHDRRDTPIILPLPQGLEARPNLTVERVDDPRPVPAQVTAIGRPSVAWVLRDEIPAGTSRRYHLRPAAAPLPPAPFSAEANDSAVRLILDGRPALTYHVAVLQPPKGIDAVFARSGFIHPLATRSGLVVTDDFPPEHAHQHGLFFAWVNTSFRGKPTDFWNQAKRTGNVRRDESRRLPVASAGRVFAEFSDSLRHDALDASGAATRVLDETWTVRAYDVPGLVMIDLESRQSCAGPEPLALNKYHYGGLGIRGNRAWGDPSAKGENLPNPARSGQSNFLTSEGKTRADGNHTRPRWVDLHGNVDGRPCGVAILGHPSNFRFPQPVRLHPNMPYFCFAPMVLGEFEIEPGKPYVSRYRIVVHDGPPDPKLLDRLWDDFADPPLVRVLDAP
ncbi:MAG TPA: PmoA family protein [Isosphaeraceae bacterium]|jgi:hypothetical protein